MPQDLSSTAADESADSRSTAPSTAEPLPSPDATASPVDVSAAFNTALTDPYRDMRIVITGSVTIGDVSMPMEGSIDARGGNSHVVLSTRTPEGQQATETMSVDGRAYRFQAGAWFVDTSESSDPSSPSPGDACLAGVFAGGFRDSGPEDREGQTLHRLTVSPAVDASAGLQGLSVSTRRDPGCDITGWAQPDGTPVSVELTATWDQQIGKGVVPATLTLTMQFSDSPHEVIAPAEVWTWKTSKVAGYTIGHPSDWEYAGKIGKGVDGFNGYDGSMLVVGRYSAKQSLNAITHQIAAHPREFSGMRGAKVDGQSALKLDGVSARRIDLHGKYDQAKVWLTVIVAVKGDRVYLLEYFTEHSPSASDRERLDTMLATFSFK